MQNKNEYTQPGRISVVNVKDYGGPDGFEKASKNNVYIGRRPGGNILGNPFTHIQDKKTMAQFVVNSRQESVDRYAEYFDKKYGTDPAYTKAIDGLYDRVKGGEDITLGCWCKPLACHGDIIKEKLEQRIRREVGVQEKPQGEISKAIDAIYATKMEEMRRDTDADGNEYRLADAQIAGSAFFKTVREAVDKGMDSAVIRQWAAAKAQDITDITDSQKKVLDSTFGIIPRNTIADEKKKGEEVTGIQDDFRRKAEAAVASGKLKSVGELRDGWALVQAPNGKYNYTNPEGKFMTKNWLDSASEFTDGKATVTRGGTVATINTEGICIAAKAEQSLHR